MKIKHAVMLMETEYGQQPCVSA